MAVKVREVDGAWWVLVNWRGQRKKRSIGKGTAAKEAAKVVAKKVAAQLALGDLTFLSATSEAPTTFAAHAEKWLKTAVRGRLKVATAELYERVIRLHWQPVLGNTPLPAITREQIKRTLGTWLANGVRSKSVQGRLAILASCLGSAVDDESLKHNPATRLGKYATKSDEKAAVVEVFRPDESRAILEAAARECPEWAPMFLVLFRAGLRLGEALTLQWDDLDLGRRELRVRRTWGSRKAKSINPPKGNRERRVDMSQQLAETLTKHRDRQQVEAVMAGREIGPWVFPGPDGQPILPTAFWQLWTRILKVVGVPHRKPHAARHTFATRLIEQGESLAYVRDQLGHSSIKITVDIYGHLTPGANRSAVDRLDAQEATVEVRAG